MAVVSAADALPVAAVVVENCEASSKIESLHAVVQHLLANALLASAVPATVVETATVAATSAKQSVTSTVTAECKATLAAA